MIDLGFLKGRCFAVLGLGRSGLATARALAAAGARALAWDDGAGARAQLAEIGLAPVPLTPAALADAEALVLSPGIPRGHPQAHPAVLAAQAAGVPVISDIDLLARACPRARFLGVTGTNGKSTTTALIGHVLATAGVPVQVGGNLGTPALALEALSNDGWYVLELSSYQLETLTEPAWSVGVFLNITPDHLDRYPDMAAYVAAKRRLFARPGPVATAVIGVDDAWSRQTAGEIARRAGWRVVSVMVEGGESGGDGLAVRDGRLIDETGRQIADLRPLITLPGAHNRQNAAAAYAACRAVGVPETAIVAALASFPGLAHRQQLVAERDGVRFVNDSKATNPDAAAKALASYDRIFWIAGGRPKPGGLGVALERLDRVAGAWLIGEAAETFAAELSDRVPVECCGTLGRAVVLAAAAAQAAHAADGRTATVLLSPACASFDQFSDFEARGMAFIGCVRELLGDESQGGAAA